MLDFVEALEQLVTSDRDCKQWELGNVADFCNLPCHKVIEYLTSALNEEINAREPLSRSILLQVLVILKEKIKPQLIARQKTLLKKQEQTSKLYEHMMQRVRNLQSKGDWHKAYRSVSYFAGESAKYLTREMQSVLYNDCLYLGSKAKANIQELGGWLHRAVESALSDPTPDSVRDALDFVDTYKDIFINRKDKCGSKLLLNIFAPLKEQALINNVQLPSLQLEA